MSQVEHEVLVHLVGHHELYVEFAGPAGPTLTLHTAHGTFSTGKAVGALAASSPRVSLQEDRLTFSKGGPLSWRKGEFDARLATRSTAAASLLGAPLVAARLPILAPVLRLVRDASRPEGKARKISLLLISVGDVASSAQRGSSTEAIAATIAAMLERCELRDDLAIEHMHFETKQALGFEGIAPFVRRVNDAISRRRREVVDGYPDAWSSRFRVSLSINTGPTPMIVALTRGIEEHAPRLIVVPDPRRWPEQAGRPLRFDAQALDPDGVRQRPAATVDEAASPPAHRFAVEQMRAWRDAFLTERPRRPGQPAGTPDKEYEFWFRKGAQEVLALLVVRDPANGELTAFRGVNLEVSLPTGTLCAERNAIGTAFASLPRLQRRHIEAVAVLSLGNNPRLGPCGACTEWLRKMAEANPDLRVLTFADPACTQVFVDPVG